MYQPTSYLPIQERMNSLEIINDSDTVIDVERVDSPLLESPSFFSRCVRACRPSSVSSLFGRVRASLPNITAKNVKEFVWENKEKILFGVAANGVAYYVASATDLEPEDVKWQIYTLFGVLTAAHGYQLCKSISKKKKLRSVIHSCSAGLAVTYPILMETGRLHLGWHHMSFGLAALVPGYKALGLFGLAMVGDEILYYDELGIFHHNKTQQAIQDMVGNESLDDRFVDYFQPIIAGLTVITVLEEVLEYRKKRRIAARAEERDNLVLEEIGDTFTQVENTTVV